MKAERFNPANLRSPKNRLMLLLPVLLLLIVSCQKGDEPYPGMAFVSLSWEVTEPEYIEMENPFIPPVFYWDWFYRIDPGVYFIYYEGRHRVGGKATPYAWELEYEIWEYEGKRGRHYWQDGEPGPDAYFTIICLPFGPEVYHEKYNTEKRLQSEEQIMPALGTEKEIVLEEFAHSFGIRLRYRQVIPRSTITE
jgi:hypothetical protein